LILITLEARALIGFQVYVTVQSGYKRGEVRLVSEGPKKINYGDLEGNHGRLRNSRDRSGVRENSKSMRAKSGDEGYKDIYGPFLIVSFLLKEKRGRDAEENQEDRRGVACSGKLVFQRGGGTGRGEKETTRRSSSRRKNLIGQGLLESKLNWYTKKCRVNHEKKSDRRSKKRVS